MSRLKLLDDVALEPSLPRPDLLDFSGHVEAIATSIIESSGPLVIHIDGAWGTGKHYIDNVQITHDAGANAAPDEGRYLERLEALCR